MNVPTKPPMDDLRLEHIIGGLLRIGVTLAVVIVLCGGMKYLLEPPPQPMDRRTFSGEPRELKNLAGIIKSAAHLDARGLIQLGIVVLIATPIARVIFSVYAFWLEGDRLYVGITLLVLTLLIVGFL